MTVATHVTLQTTDGRIVDGISYSAAGISTNLPAMVALMPGQMAMGIFHVRGPRGWEYIPASQVSSILRASMGAQT